MVGHCSVYETLGRSLKSRILGLERCVCTRHCRSRRLSTDMPLITQETRPRLTIDSYNLGLVASRGNMKCYQDLLLLCSWFYHEGRLRFFEKLTRDFTQNQQEIYMPVGQIVCLLIRSQRDLVVSRCVIGIRWKLSAPCDCLPSPADVWPRANVCNRKSIVISKTGRISMCLLNLPKAVASYRETLLVSVLTGRVDWTIKLRLVLCVDVFVRTSADLC